MSLNLQGQQFSVILHVAIFSIKTFKISLNLQGQYFKAISAILPAWKICVKSQWPLPLGHVGSLYYSKSCFSTLMTVFVKLHFFVIYNMKTFFF